MPVIDLKFQKKLEEGFSLYREHHGLAFHRWLPDGEKDAIILDTKYSNTKLKLWFERFGHTERGMIDFNVKRKEVDPTIMVNQGSLESGPLFAKIEAFEITDEELKILKDNKIGSKEYQDIGNRIAKIIDPILTNFLYLLRIHFGQYWLPTYEEFDSTKKSIGEHLRFLFINWSEDGGKTWNEFTPDNIHAPVNAVMSSTESFLKLITKKDWTNLQNFIKDKHNESLAAITLARTHQYIEQNDIRHAFFEGITALELSIEEFVHNRIKDKKVLIDNIQGFWNLPLRAKIISITTTLDLPSDDIENTVTAIIWRNKIIHEGWNPEYYQARKHLISLLHVTSKLLQGPEFKFPNYGGNILQPKERWDKLE